MINYRSPSSTHTFDLQHRRACRHRLPTPDSNVDVAVAGGSIGGLSAGLALHGAGFDVEIYERHPGPMETRGAGIVVQDLSFWEAREAKPAGIAFQALRPVWPQHFLQA